jgi:predicted amidohydrolase YtcJ
MSADLILFNGQFHTVDRTKPLASAVAITDGRFVVVGNDNQAMALRGPNTQVVDMHGRCVIPGLNDSHLHLIRGGLNYNLELRWEGVPSLADALRMLKDQADRTPTPQWVRVVGGWNEFQFAEKRMPTLEEINAGRAGHPGVHPAPVRPRPAQPRRAARGRLHPDTPNPPGGEIVRDANGNPTGMLIARPNAMILYSTLAKGPKLPLEYQVNSTRQFMRELNRLGLTSAIDAGGGFQNYPDDYQVIEQLAKDDQLTVRIAYNLFTQNKGQELRRLPELDRHGQAGPGQRLLPRTTAPARCWCSRRPTSKTSWSRARTCRKPWKKSWNRWCATWSNSAGRSACTPPTTNRSAHARRVREGQPRDSLQRPAWMFDHARPSARRTSSG